MVLHTKVLVGMISRVSEEKFSHFFDHFLRENLWLKNTLFSNVNFSEMKNFFKNRHLQKLRTDLGICFVCSKIK